MILRVARPLPRARRAGHRLPRAVPRFSYAAARAIHATNHGPSPLEDRHPHRRCRHDRASATARASAKDSARIAAIGEVDELNSTLGLLLAEPLPGERPRASTRRQHDLFDLGGELSIPGYTAVTDAHVARLEDAVDAFNADLGAAEGIHPARRRRGPRRSRTSRAPSAAAPSVRSSTWRRAMPVSDAVAPLPQPALGSAVRARAHAQPRGGPRPTCSGKGIGAAAA